MDRMTCGIPERVAERLAEYVILGIEPDSPTISATYWENNNGYFAAAWAAVEHLVAGSPAASAHLHQLREEPSSETYRRLRGALGDLLSANRQRSVEIGAWLDAWDDKIQLGYHVGSGHVDRADPISLERIRLLKPRKDPRAANGAPADDHELLVVIPFRDDDGSHRLRNLLACLLSLRDQSLASWRFSTTVVEADTVPRREAHIASLTDHYIHAPSSRPLFNKSWTMNVGVVHTPGDPPYLCLLDADMLVDRDFLARNLSRIMLGQHTAHLPYQRGDLLTLNGPSSDLVIRRRIFECDPGFDIDELRGHLLLAAPGGCVWATSTAYQQIGGFDERFEGWGGEDDDFIERLTRNGEFVRFGDTMIHLHHPRPSMRVDGRHYNAHIEWGTWDPANGYGQLTPSTLRDDRSGYGALTGGGLAP
jgi:hypothetical protein